MFPLLQCHACKLAKLSACIDKWMTTINKIYIYIYITAIFKTGNGESGNGNGERGTGKGESLKWGIFKSGNL